MVIETCVAPDPRDRFSSCDEVIYWLQKDDSGRYHFEDFDADYRESQKKKLVRCASFAAACIVFAAVAIGARAMGKSEMNSDYQNLMANQDYAGAIAIAPTRIDAYEKLLETDMESDGTLTQKESVEIEGLADAYVNKGGDTKAPDYLKFCYDMAYAYFNVYTVDADKNSNDEESMQKAKKYLDILNSAFEENEKLENQIISEYPQMAAWRSYYTLTDNYGKSNRVDKPNFTKQELEDELDAIEECLEQVDGGSSLVRIKTLERFANLVNSMTMRNQFTSAGISKDRVIKTLNAIKSEENRILSGEADSEVRAECEKALSTIDTFIGNLNDSYSINLKH